MTASVRAMPPSRRARGALLALPLLIAACDNGPAGTGSSVPLAGPYAAREAVADDGSDLVAGDHSIGLRVGTEGALPIFRLAVVPPAVQFQAPVVYEGYVEALANDRIQFLSRAMEPLDAAHVVASDNNGSVLEFDEGRFGFRRAEFAPADRPGDDEPDGAFTAQTLTLHDADGASTELAGSDPPATITFSAHSATYRLEVTAPAGAIADTAVSLSYHGLYDLIGPVLVLGGAFGCPTFAASATLAERLVFRGYACEIDGRPWRVDGAFDPQ